MPHCHHAVDFVESMGLLWESEGFPRIAGRIFGYLVVQPEPCSLDDLAAALGVSKASISTDARRLEQHGLITRVSLPGDRRDYYVLDADAPITGMELRLRSLRRFDKCLLDISDRERLPAVVRERLERFEYAQRRIMQALEQILSDLRSTAAPAAPPSDTPTP